MYFGIHIITKYNHIIFKEKKEEEEAEEEIREFD